MNATDDELVTRARAGDRDAISAILERSADSIAAELNTDIAPRWRPVLDVDDVMQVSFLEAFLQAERFTGSDLNAFKSWFRRIAVNNLHDAVRALQCEKRPQPTNRVQSSAGQDSYTALLECLGGSVSTPSTKAARHENAELVSAALARLPADYRMAIELYDLQGLSGPQVARRMQRSRGAVHMLRARGLARLRELLGSGSDFFSRSG